MILVGFFIVGLLVSDVKMMNLLDTQMLDKLNSGGFSGQTIKYHRGAEDEISPETVVNNRVCLNY